MEHYRKHGLEAIRKEMLSRIYFFSSCDVSLTPGRYEWRREQVQRKLADILEKKRMEKREQNLN